VARHAQLQVIRLDFDLAQFGFFQQSGELADQFQIDT
jgi:hypothetical protein